VSTDLREAAATVDAIVNTLGRFIVFYAPERQVHDAVEDILEREGYEPAREVRISNRDRVDLLVDRVAVEVKITGDVRAVERQVNRYLESDQIDGLVLATTRAIHRRIRPDSPKPFRVLQLNTGGIG
jgi:hypothetical protein